MTTGNRRETKGEALKKVPAVVLWAVGFAFVESAVVEYLRALYYPLSAGGFTFPVLTLEQIKAMGEDHWRRLLIELGREAATLVMLAAVANAAAGNRREAWAHFLIAFGVWDIFYYVWLKLFIDWPADFATWDLLFLLPVPWVSPVAAPLIVSAVMIGSGLTVLTYEARGRPLMAGMRDWALITLGGVVVIVSFCWDSGNIMAGGLPAQFNWPLFFAGLILSLTTFVTVVLRSRRGG